VAGIVIPSALAVLRLMTSSNIVGCSMGKLAGCAPLNICPPFQDSAGHRTSAPLPRRDPLLQTR
jgi:hypothetical protein